MARTLSFYSNLYFEARVALRCFHLGKISGRTCPNGGRPRPRGRHQRAEAVVGSSIGPGVALLRERAPRFPEGSGNGIIPTVTSIIYSALLIGESDVVVPNCPQTGQNLSERSDDRILMAVRKKSK